MADDTDAELIAAPLEAGLLRTLLAECPEGVLAFDRDCRYTVWNPVMERISGLPASAVLGKVAFEVFPFLLETGEDRAFHEALAGREAVSRQRPYTVATTGRSGLFEARYVPLRDAAGTVTGGLTFVRDVTIEGVLRRREEALELHSRVLQSMREGVSVTDSEGRLVFTNRAEDEMFGYLPGELVGQRVTVLNAYPPEENERVVGQVIATLRRDGLWVGEWLNRRKDGSTFVTRSEITALDTADGPYWLCVQQDVTQERQVRRALLETGQQLAVALDAAQLGTWSWDAATDIVTFGERAAALFAIPAGPAMTWTRMLQLLHPDDREPTRLAVEVAVAERRDYDAEYRVVLPGGGERWIAARGRAVYDGEGRALGMHGVVADVTTRKQAEQALREEARVLVEDERQARERAHDLADADRRKDEFLAVLAHELRNPLGAISNALHVIGLGAAEPDRFRRALDVAVRQVALQSRLVDDLLDVSRIARGKIRLKVDRVDLAAVVREVAEDHRSALEHHGLTFVVDLPETPVPVEGDRARLVQVLGNLLDNARKFTPAGGEVRVTLAPGDGQARVEVADSGVGIEPAVLPRLFTPFAQGDRTLARSQGGLGLGLALVKGLVELHPGGKVEAASSGPDLGTAVVLSLPLAAAPTEVVAARTAGRPREGLRILVVDDLVDVGDSMAELLSVYGCEPLVARSGAEALALAAREQPDLVLCDIGLPDLDGYETARRLKADPATAAIPLVALTGYGGPQDQRKSREAGFATHLVKPVLPDELMAAVALLTGGGDPDGG